MLFFPRSRTSLALGTALLGLVACSGGGTPTTPATTPATTPVTTPPTTVPAVAVGSPAPDAAASCRYGKGTVDTRCQRQAPRFVADVDAAISELTRQEPQLFNF